MNIPRYLISFTNEITVPADSDTGRHEALFLGPIHKQHDLRVLTAISSSLPFCHNPRVSQTDWRTDRQNSHR